MIQHLDEEKDLILRSGCGLFNDSMVQSRLKYEYHSESGLLFDNQLITYSSFGIGQFRIQVSEIKIKTDE